MSEDFKTDPRSYAIELVEEGIISAEQMVQILVGAMSTDEVREALDANKVSPRFMEAV
jgi:predicted HTH domain antitoxin